MKRLILLLIFSITLMSSYSNICNAQAHFYKYYTDPNGSYNYEYYDNGGDGFTIPPGSYYYRYNGSDVNEMMEQFNRVFQQFFSQNYNFGNNFNAPFYNESPDMPNFFGNNGFPGFENEFQPKTPDVAPAPSFEDAPEIYY
ncbi:MAG: hypothetical protein AB1782_15440 [Cyanobacteriota bacterium]